MQMRAGVAKKPSDPSDSRRSKQLTSSTRTPSRAWIRESPGGKSKDGYDKAVFS